MLSRVGVRSWRLLDWMIGFINTLYIQLRITGSYSVIAISTLYSSPSHMHLGYSVFTSRIPATDLWLQTTHEGVFAQSSSFLAIPFQSPSNPISKIRPNSRQLTQTSKSKVTLRLTASQSVSLGVKPPSGAHDQIFYTVWHLRSCFCGAPSLTRGRVSLLYMLLALASAVFLGSESLGTRDQPLYCWEGLFTDPLFSNGRPILAGVRFCGNVFTESLPSNGSIRRNILSQISPVHPLTFF
jgi:hypothetical protein